MKKKIERKIVGFTTVYYGLQGYTRPYYATVSYGLQGYT